MSVGWEIPTVHRRDHIYTRQNGEPDLDAPGRKKLSARWPESMSPNSYPPLGVSRRALCSQGMKAQAIWFGQRRFIVPVCSET